MGFFILIFESEKNSEKKFWNMENYVLFDTRMQILGVAPPPTSKQEWEKV